MKYSEFKKILEFFNEYAACVATMHNGKLMVPQMDGVSDEYVDLYMQTPDGYNESSPSPGDVLKWVEYSEPTGEETVTLTCYDAELDEECQFKVVGVEYNNYRLFLLSEPL